MTAPTTASPSRPASGARRFGVPLGLFFGGLLVWACRSGEGDRCICGDDCRAGLVCVADGRVLEADECNAVVGPTASPGQCVDEADAGVADDGGGAPEVFMDLGSKRDFDPGLPPDGETESDSGGSSSGGGSSSDGGSSSSGGSSSEGGSSSSDGGSSSSDGGSSSSDGGSSSSDGGSSSSDGGSSSSTTD